MEIPTLDKFPPSALAAIDIQRAFIVSRVIIAAERLQLFRALDGRRLTAEDLGAAVHIHSRYREVFFNSLVSLGLLRKTRENYSLTPLARKYFIRERSIYWTRQYSKECVQAYDALTVLEKALATGRSCASIKGFDKISYTESMQRDPRHAEDFTQMLFHYHHDDAEALAGYLDLSHHRAVLDVGGGSGVMSIALARRNPHLRASVLDLVAVCRVAAGNIRRAGLARRIRTLAGDIREPLPTGYDVIMFCDIGAIPPQLLRNAYRALPPGGLVVAVDRHLSADRTRPLDRIVASLIGSTFPMTTRAEMVAALELRGFQRVKARNVYRDLWFITGVKPR